MIFPPTFFYDFSTNLISTDFYFSYKVHQNNGNNSIKLNETNFDRVKPHANDEIIHIIPCKFIAHLMIIIHVVASPTSKRVRRAFSFGCRYNLFFFVWLWVGTWGRAFWFFFPSPAGWERGFF